MTRTAIVTGSGTGIGLATARALVAASWSVTLVGRRPDVLDAAASELTGTGGDVCAIAADLSDPSAPASVVRQHVGRTGGLDAVVHAAGAYEPTDLATADDVHWNAAWVTHVRGAALLCQAASEAMAVHRFGRIVLLASINGLVSEPSTAAYSAAKAAVISLARSMAVDLAPLGITCNAVSPGWVATPMTAAALTGLSPDDLARLNPLARVGRPAEVAELIRFLVVDAPAFLTGANIVIDGGQTARAVTA